MATPAVAFTSTRPIQDAPGADAAPALVTLATPYGLTSRADLSLSGGFPGGLSQVHYAGSTALTGLDPAAAPGPASVVPILTAFPLAVLGLRWRRAK